MASCVLCNANLDLGVEKIDFTCPNCRGQGGYQLYEYHQTDENFDRNHKQELDKHQRGEKAFTGGMCFANTLLWMKFKKLNGIKDLDVFERKYAKNLNDQSAFYNELVSTMGSQESYINALYADFNTLVCYDLLFGTSNADVSRPAGTLQIPFSVRCKVCGEGTAKLPMQNTKPSNVCAKCGNVGTVIAEVKCRYCLDTVVFDKPSQQRCNNNHIVVITPAIECGRIEGRQNQIIAHNKKQGVYQKLSKQYGLEMIKYQHGFNFGAQIDTLTDIAFSKEQELPTGYCGVINFEGDSGNAHVTSFWVRKGRVGFFEPNFGEYLFPDKQTFKIWFKNLLNNTSWPQDNISYAEMRAGWYVALFK